MKRPATELPPGFGISERVRKWAAGKGYTGLDEQLEVFQRKVRMHGYVYVSWDDAFMECIAKDWGHLRQPASHKGNGQSRPESAPWLDPDVGESNEHWMQRRMAARH